MQHPAPPTQGYPNHGYPQSSPYPGYPQTFPYPPAQLYAPPPHGGYPPTWGFPNAYNPYPGSVFNTGGNTNGSGYQKNGDIKVGNQKHRSGGVEIGTIGGNHGNRGGQQVSGDVNVGDISGG